MFERAFSSRRGRVDPRVQRSPCFRSNQRVAPQGPCQAGEHSLPHSPESRFCRFFQLTQFTVAVFILFTATAGAWVVATDLGKVCGTNA